MEIRGWVYVMFNEAMPDLVKVGFTLKDPNLRASELNSSGTPKCPKVVFEVLVESPRDVEQSAHAKLKSKHEGKEWFRCSVGDAIGAVRATISEQRKTIIFEATLTESGESVAYRGYYQNTTYDYNRLPSETIVHHKVTDPILPIGDLPQGNRRRLRELLSIPEKDRSNEQWSEIVALEVTLSPRNRVIG